MTTEDTDDLLEEAPKEAYELGRGEDLYTKPNQFEKIVYYDHENKKQYPLEIREVGWAEIGRIESEAQKVIMRGNSPDIKFDNAKYRKLCFCAMVVKHPFPDKLEIAYIKLGTDFGNWFSNYIPAAGGGITTEEEDLSDEQ